MGGIGGWGLGAGGGWCGGAAVLVPCPSLACFTSRTHTAQIKLNRRPQTPPPPTNHHHHPKQIAQTRAVEERVRDRVPLGGHLGYRKLMDDLMALGCTPQAVGLAVKVMLARGELKRKAEGKMLQRVR